MPGEKIMRSLPSFYSISWEVKVGDFVKTTIDCFSRPGVVQLMNESEEQLEKDTVIVHSLGKFGLLDFSIICPEPPLIGAVVVIDPFSSGANLAAMVIRMGYKLILAFSEKNSPVAKLVSKTSAFTTSFIVQHDNLSLDQNASVEETILNIKSFSLPILAILPGAETGVELAGKIISFLSSFVNYNFNYFF
jgi:hypothetical protein